jgi:hypothetical protein
MEYKDSDKTCHLSMAKLRAVCGKNYQECITFLSNSKKGPQCDPVFLGKDIGLANIFKYNDDDGSCHLDLKELSRVCNVHFKECLSFLQSSECKAGFGKAKNGLCAKCKVGTHASEGANKCTPCKKGTHDHDKNPATACVDEKGSKGPSCDKVFLGPDIGYQHIMEFHDDDGSCHLSLRELAKVCKQHYQQCISFLQSKSPQKPQPKCDAVFLGPDIGYQNVLKYHDDDGSCHLSMQELAAVCKEHYKQCLAFLSSKNDKKPTCEKIYLGSDLGYQNIMAYNDKDKSCHLSIKELQAVCKDHFKQCLAFLQSSKKKPQCEPVFLGPDIGFMNIFKYHDEDATCHLDLKELSAACKEFFSQCLAFLESSGTQCKIGSGNRSGYSVQKPKGGTVNALGKITCAKGYKGSKPKATCAKKGGEFKFEGCSK